MKYANIISDTNSKSLKIKNFLLSKIPVNSIKKSSLIVVIGGDGFMLQTLKKYYKFNKPFYGINSGNYGFLMNKFSKDKTQSKTRFPYPGRPELKRHRPPPDYRPKAPLRQPGRHLIAPRFF